MINIFRNQQNILYVCPTESSGTRERMILRDCLLLKEIGHNVFLYCLKDSFLDINSKKHGIDCLYHEGGTHTTFLKWYKLRRLKNYIRKLDVNIVHCYELNFLWPLAYFLRNKHLTPLFFTLNHDVHKFYKKFWYKTLISRLDLIFLPVREMSESIHGHMEIPLRKIYYSGLGLKQVEFHKVKKKLNESVWNLACWVNDHEKSDEDLSVCFESLWALNMRKKDHKPYHLHIYSNRKWSENILLEKLNKKIQDYKLENYVHFHESSNVFDINADIWISYNTKIPLEDYSLVSILKGIPAMMPRNATTQELNRIYGDANVTYKAGDSRELRKSLELLSSSYHDYVGHCEKAKDELWVEHGEDGYKYNLFKIYEKHLNKRRRFYS
ncbi:MAG: hypothetical protein BM556_04590 [Bacteriovorax sp. MedPE-SWde]|nr:MAG: hypothetical protein BM556_04590 [Bacteriovorax sp. MedPE-SWde]